LFYYKTLFLIKIQRKKSLKEGKQMLNKKSYRFSTKAKRSMRAISPVIATLLMIAIAVAASLVAYAWVMGYMGFTTSKVDKAIMIQSVTTDGVYVQNVGDSLVWVTGIYVNGVADDLSLNQEIDKAETIYFEFAKKADYATLTRMTVKVVCNDGTMTEFVKTNPGAGGGGGGGNGGTPALKYYKPITFNGVVGTHADFPVLVSVSSDSQIGARATSGNQIYFTDNTGATVLASEIESFSNAAGSASLTAWVKVPTLTSTTSIRIYYGSTNPNPQPTTAVWDSNYKGVWHLNEVGSGTAGEYKDSTNTHNGQGGSGATPTLIASGKIGGAQDFSNDYINVGGQTTLHMNTEDALTLEAWVRADSTPTWSMIISRQQGSSGGDAYLLGLSSDDRAILFVNGRQVYSSSALTMGQWYHLVGVASSSSVTLYVNGVQAGTAAGTTWNFDTANRVLIGAGDNPGPSEYFDGIIDEARISNVVRPLNWIQTEYSNMNNPSGFINLGSEQQITL
jgi:flagellin-like protein